MTTTTKWIVGVLVALVVIWTWPAALFPVALGLGLLALGGGLALAIGATLLAVLVVLGSGVIAVLACLAPIWVPVLLIVGLIALIRAMVRPAA